MALFPALSRYCTTFYLKNVALWVPSKQHYGVMRDPRAPPSFKRLLRLKKINMLLLYRHSIRNLGVLCAPTHPKSILCWVSIQFQIPVFRQPRCHSFRSYRYVKHQKTIKNIYRREWNAWASLKFSNS